MNYAASGSDIFYLHAGPDGCVYSSSILPLHLFQYHPGKGELVDLGQCSQASAEAADGNLDGKMYISSYPGARVSVYDPAQHQIRRSPESNPRELGRIDDISYRPRSTLAGPLGRVWLASIPDYGMWGGPLSYYDPRSGEKKAYYRIFGDGSCYTLAHLEGQKLLAIGTSISGGSGTQPKIELADLLLWDYTTEKIVWQGRPDAGDHLQRAGGSSQRKLVRHHHGRRTPRSLNSIRNPKPSPPGGRFPKVHLDLGLQNGPDGLIYGFTIPAFIVSIRPNVKASDPAGKIQHSGPSGPGHLFRQRFKLQAARILRTGRFRWLRWF